MGQRGVDGVKLASIHTTDQEEEEGVYGEDPGAQLFFMGFLKSREVTSGSGSIQ